MNNVETKVERNGTILFKMSLANTCRTCGKPLAKKGKTLINWDNIFYFSGILIFGKTKRQEN